jgi:hypothetical protein
MVPDNTIPASVTHRFKGKPECVLNVCKDQVSHI